MVVFIQAAQAPDTGVLTHLQADLPTTNLTPWRGFVNVEAVLPAGGLVGNSPVTGSATSETVISSGLEKSFE